MKKYTFLVFHKEYDEFLKEIQNIGVIHVIEKQRGTFEDEETKRIHQQLTELKNAIKFLTKKLPEKSVLQPVTNKHAGDILDQLHHITSKQEASELRLAQVSKERLQLKPWGDFDWQNIHRLRKSGWNVMFFCCPTKKINPAWTDKFFYSVINEASGQTYFITLTKQDENPDIELEEIKLPENRLSVLEQEESAIKEQLASINTLYNEFAVQYLSTLNLAQQHTSSELDYKKVTLNTSKEAEEKLMLLEGWVPTDSEEKLCEYLDKQSIYSLATKPELADNVPVKLKNNKFVQLFEVIGELYSLPNYRELDLTPLFAPFFMLFFGFCLGDAGYGLFLLLIASVIKFVKKGSKLRPILTLVQWLSLSTIIMGFISGTFFGIPLLEIEGLSIKKYMLNSNQLFNLALILGLIQIIFGLCVKAYSLCKFKGFKYALSTFGWILLITGMITVFGLDKMKMLSTVFKPILMYTILGISGFLILIFNDPNSNPLVSSLKGVWDVYGMVSGVFGDTLSYIRLFALGTSGAILGYVINTIALQILGIAYVGPIFFVIFLLLGHAMTIGLSILGAFVHPMRLTFVEFYKNAGFEGGGKRYSPFKLETNK